MYSDGRWSRIRRLMVKSKELVERNGAGAFLISVDGNQLMQLVGGASSQGMGISWGCWLKIIVEEDEEKLNVA